MEIKKIIKVILIYVVYIYFGIWFNNIIQDKDLYNGIFEIFNNYDYRAINCVILINNFCVGYCIYKLIRFIINKVKKKEIINNEIN